MIIILEQTLPNLAVARYHRLHAIEIDSNRVVARVNSYATEAQANLLWQDQYEVSSSALSANPMLSVAESLVAVGGPFEGGALISPTMGDFAIARARLKQAIKELRNQADWGGCDTPSGRIDSDAASQLKINGAVSLALVLGESFTVNWRMSDNSIVTLDAPAMIAIGIAVATKVAACQLRKNALDAEVAAAETLEDLAAIDIYSGWPE